MGHERKRVKTPDLDDSITFITKLWVEMQNTSGIEKTKNPYCESKTISILKVKTLCYPGDQIQSGASFEVAKRILVYIYQDKLPYVASKDI